MAFMDAPDFFYRTRKGRLFHAGFSAVRQSGSMLLAMQRAFRNDGGQWVIRTKNHVGGIKRCLKKVC
jgi:hypothetical protein